mmetsp:Transcript_24584/g.85487  ORF Transcript_24584/g.85487 Transcript_24584/m.85487 type:complete len:222 (+) Transcript_24584:2462-3127(+)
MSHSYRSTVTASTGGRPLPSSAGPGTAHFLACGRLPPHDSQSTSTSVSAVSSSRPSSRERAPPATLTCTSRKPSVRCRDEWHTLHSIECTKLPPKMRLTCETMPLVPPAAGPPAPASPAARSSTASSAFSSACIISRMSCWYPMSAAVHPKPSCSGTVGCASWRDAARRANSRASSRDAADDATASAASSDSTHRRSGAVWKSACTTEFRKHVLPWFTRPW